MIQGLRNVFFGIALSLVFLAQAGLAASQINRDRDPWPFGKEIKIPWYGLTGVWGAVDGEVDSYFVFKPVQGPSGTILNIQQYDEYCGLMNKGVGTEKNRVVRAQFPSSNGAYNIRIRVFRKEDVDSKTTHFSTFDDTYRELAVVMTIDPPRRMYPSKTFQLIKVSEKLESICGN